MDAPQRRNRDGIFQAPHQPSRRARQPGGDLSVAAAPIIVSATFGAADFAYLEGLRRAHFPPERNQVPAHLTLFHQLPPSIGPELAHRLAGHAAGPRPSAWIAGVLDLGAGTALRVESHDLERIREDLALAFRSLLLPQDQAPWRPHVTVQNKVRLKEAKAVQALLRAGFQPRPLAIKGLAAWRYIGGPWEPIQSYSFRG